MLRLKFKKELMMDRTRSEIPAPGCYKCNFRWTEIPLRRGGISVPLNLLSRRAMTALGQDITLSTLIRNSALSGYAKGVISSPNFMNIVASIKMKQDAVTLAQLDFCADLNTLPAHEKEKLYATFPKTPAAFSNVLAYWFLQLSI